MEKIFLFLAGGGTNFKSKKEMAACASVGLLSIAMLFVHLVFLIYFLSTAVIAMTLINVASVGVYFLATAVNRSSQGVVSSALITAEICAYCIVSTLLLGWDSQTQLFLPAAMVPCFTLYPISKRASWIHTFGIIVSMFACLFLSIYAAPLTPIDLSFVVFVNVCACLVGGVLVFQSIEFGDKITEIYYKDKMDKLFDDAHKDPLTKLWNRRYARAKLDEYVHSFDITEQICIAMCDIDDFKKINDTYGHNFGDKVLCTLADTMHGSFRSSDVTVRWGGEEFLIIMTQTNSANVGRVLDNFRKQIENIRVKNEKENMDIGFTLTIGFSELQHGMNADEVIENSDKALYYGKMNGKNRVVDFKDI